jgi:hypothetical protein
MASRPMDTFVGREEELTRLERTLEDVRHTGSGALPHRLKGCRNRPFQGQLET